MSDSKIASLEKRLSTVEATIMTLFNSWQEKERARQLESNLKAGKTDPQFDKMFADYQQHLTEAANGKDKDADNISIVD